MKSNSITYRILAITMACLMFFTSVGFTVDLHYCQGKLKTFNFFGKAKSCHDLGKGMKNCPYHKKMLEDQQPSDDTVAKKSCCSNKTFHFQFDQDQQNQVVDIIVVSAALQYFVIAFVETFLNASIATAEKPSYVQYKPPLKSRDIYALLETYIL